MLTVIPTCASSDLTTIASAWPAMSPLTVIRNVVEPVRIAGLRQQLPGLGRVVRVRRDRGVEVLHLVGHERGAGDRVALVGELDDRVPVDRVVQRLAHRGLLERRVVLVELDEVDPGGREELDVSPGVPSIWLDEVARRVLDHVGLLALQHQDPGVVVGDDHDPDLADLRLGAVEVRVARQVDLAVGVVGRHAERPAADRVLEEGRALRLDQLGRDASSTRTSPGRRAAARASGTA